MIAPAIVTMISRLMSRTFLRRASAVLGFGVDLVAVFVQDRALRTCTTARL
jgi:hypothetical protein